MKKDKKAAMYQLIKDWESSNQSKSDFCNSASINIHTFTYWVQKYKKENIEQDLSSQRQNFLPLKLTKPPVVPSTQTIDLHYPNGIRLSVPQSVGLNYLTQLLQISI